MQNILLTISIIAIFTMGHQGQARAHEWDGDGWAAAQIKMTAQVKDCVEMLRRNVDTYMANCKGGFMSKVQAALTQQLILEIRQHDDTTVGDFTKTHFTNEELAVGAIASTRVALTGLQYIVRMLELEQRKIEREVFEQELKENPIPKRKARFWYG